jgi:hypothetical protein
VDFGWILELGLAEILTSSSSTGKIAPLKTEVAGSSAIHATEDATREVPSGRYRRNQRGMRRKVPKPPCRLFGTQPTKQAGSFEAQNSNFHADFPVPRPAIFEESFAIKFRDVRAGFSEHRLEKLIKLMPQMFATHGQMM